MPAANLTGPIRILTKATINTRLNNGKPVFEGEQIKIGGNESYTSLCRKHWREGKIRP